MQEPSKGDRINEGIMKEITGGDPIQGRALYKDTITFVPHFNLVVCTNTLFDIKSNDDGTWRRIRVCDFMSKFLENPYEDEDKFPKSEYPHQFKIDKKIDEKFEIWAPLLMSMLVNVRTGFYSVIVKENGTIILNKDDNFYDFLKDIAVKKKLNVISYGIKNLINNF